jgi:hypothetical protein
VYRSPVPGDLKEVRDMTIVPDAFSAPSVAARLSVS